MRDLVGEDPLCMIPLLEKPFIEHQVNDLVRQGIRSIDFVLGRQQETVERYLGDGSWFGCFINYHRVDSYEQACALLKSICRPGCMEPILLGHDDRFPPQSVNFSRLNEEGALPIAFCDATRSAKLDGVRRAWTGWVLVSGEIVQELPVSCDRANLAASLLSRAKAAGRIIDTEELLGIRTYSEFLKANHLLLQRDLQDLRLPCQEQFHGIWVGERVRIDPTVLLVPPVYIGADCRINRGAHIGPHAAIGSHCVIEGRSLVENSVVFPNSFVGETLELSGVIVMGDHLINIRLNSSVHVTDDFILRSFEDCKAWKRLPRKLVRTISPLHSVLHRILPGGP